MASLGFAVVLLLATACVANEQPLSGDEARSVREFERNINRFVKLAESQAAAERARQQLLQEEEEEEERRLEEQEEAEREAVPGKVNVRYVHHEPFHSQDDRVQHAYDTASQLKQQRNPGPQHDIQPIAARVVQPPNGGRGGADGATTSFGDIYLLAIVAGCSVAGLVGLIFAAVCWYKLQKGVQAAKDTDYPAYGVTGPYHDGNKGPATPGDRKLAHSAQMYHYQHQKQQMLAMEKANGEMKHDGSDVDTDEENEEGDYTVYECPGLAPAGEMEVRNPLFSSETPVTPTPTSHEPPK